MHAGGRGRHACVELFLVRAGQGQHVRWAGPLKGLEFAVRDEYFWPVHISTIMKMTTAINFDISESRMVTSFVTKNN